MGCQRGAPNPAAAVCAGHHCRRCAGSDAAALCLRKASCRCFAAAKGARQDAHSLCPSCHRSHGHGPHSAPLGAALRHGRAAGPRVSALRRAAGGGPTHRRRRASCTCSSPARAWWRARAACKTRPRPQSPGSCMSPGSGSAASRPSAAAACDARGARRVSGFGAAGCIAHSYRPPVCPTLSPELQQPQHSLPLSTQQPAVPWLCASCCWQCAVPARCSGASRGRARHAQDTHARGARASATTLYAALTSAACAGHS